MTSWDAFVKWFIGLLDMNFVSICFILLVVMVFLWSQDRQPQTQFKIVNFFKTNDHEDMAKLVMFLMTIVIMWSMIQQVKADDLDIYGLLAYMAYSLGAPIFYSMLKTITAVFGKPEIVNKIGGNGNGNGNSNSNGGAAVPTDIPKGG